MAIRHWISPARPVRFDEARCPSLAALHAHPRELHLPSMQPLRGGRWLHEPLPALSLVTTCRCTPGRSCGELSRADASGPNCSMRRDVSFSFTSAFNAASSDGAVPAGTTTSRRSCADRHPAFWGSRYGAGQLPVTRGGAGTEPADHFWELRRFGDVDIVAGETCGSALAHASRQVLSVSYSSSLAP